jgi:hypothetical protein
MVVRLRNEWVPVDPRVWKNRYDMTISVGLGTGNREQQMGNLMAVMNVQKEAFQAGIVTPENIYNSATKLAEIAGFKSPEMFFTNKEPQATGIPPELQKQIQDQAQKMQQEIQKLQGENQQLKGEILKRDTDTSVKVYEVDKRAETEIQKTAMQNESKEQLATFQAMADAIMQSQTALTNKVEEVEDKEIDFGPVMEALKGLQEQIMGSQPVGIKQIRDENGRLIGGVRVLADGTEQEISIQ